MPKLLDINHKKASFQVVRQSKHIAMANDDRIIIISKANLINAYTMAEIVKDACLTIEKFKQFL